MQGRENLKMKLMVGSGYTCPCVVGLEERVRWRSTRSREVGNNPETVQWWEESRTNKLLPTIFFFKPERKLFQALLP